MRQRLVQQIRHVGVGLCSLVLAASVCATDPSPAWAKGKKEEAPAAPEKDYVKPYGLVVLSIVLGTMLVYRPGRRSDEVKRKVEEE